MAQNIRKPHRCSRKILEPLEVTGIFGWLVGVCLCVFQREPAKGEFVLFISETIYHQSGRWPLFHFPLKHQRRATLKHVTHGCVRFTNGSLPSRQTEVSGLAKSV